MAADRILCISVSRLSSVVSGLSFVVSRIMDSSIELTSPYRFEIVRRYGIEGTREWLGFSHWST